MEHKIKKLLGRKTWAVVGVSDNPDKMSHKIYQTLRKAGLEVYPVNPLYEKIGEDRCYPSWSDVPVKPDVINVVVNKERAVKLLDSLPKSDAWEGKLTIWFQPETYDDAVLELAHATGHDVIYDHCSMKEMRGLMQTIAKEATTVVAWLREKMKESGTTGLVLGVSGGIDSALAAGLIAKAAPEGALGLILPCHSAPSDVEDAKRMVETFGLKSHTIDLSETHRSILQALEQAQGETPSRMTDANLRARLRMATLYAFANQNNALVVGTDNAAEILTGYYTKYGDGGVDVLPLAALLKGEVYLWARQFGVPTEVLRRKPSAGLWEGQTDEGEMGTTYEYIDDYLRGLPIPEADRTVIERMHRVTEHKRNMPPHAPLGR